MLYRDHCEVYTIILEHENVYISPAIQHSHLNHIPNHLISTELDLLCLTLHRASIMPHLFPKRTEIISVIVGCIQHKYVMIKINKRERERATV